MVDSKLNNAAEIFWKGPGGSLEVVELQYRQSLSAPHFIQVVLKSPKNTLDFARLIGAEASVVLKNGQDLAGERFFHGIISSMSHQRTGHGNLPNASRQAFFYEIQLRPKHWKLSHVIRSRVYYRKNSQEIIAEILNEFGINFDWQVNGPLEKREYTVQFQESCLQFVQRLLEDEGIYYFFEHAGESPKLVITDNGGAHQPCEPFADANYSEGGGLKFKQSDKEFLQHVGYEESMGSGTYVSNDYNHETSQMNLLSPEVNGERPNFSDLEVYEHPANRMTAGTNKSLAKYRQEMVTAGRKVLSGHGTTRSFECGRTFNLKHHYQKELNAGYLLTEVMIQASQGTYGCHFLAIPQAVPYRPPRKTPQPKVFGLQTAVVTGPSGQDVYLDKLGRCKLQFHWDREGEKNDRSSMWVRVSNGYAGKNYGIQWIPRVGHEVLVEFIDGNPDRPVVVGRVYNDTNTPPLGPQQKRHNIIKTINDNHILFIDEDDKEMFDIRAQRDMKTLVVRNKSLNVGSNETIYIGNDTSTTVENNADEQVKNDKSLTVDRDFSTYVKSDKTVEVDKAYELKVGRKIKVEAGSGGIKVETKGKTAMKAKTGITIECPAGITIKSGASTIKLTPGMITIKSPMVKIN